ncbi:ABC transporter permease [Thermoactinospora rubra]|uniref:ABC transporter permease n=1 Tax=Thermoactinospora rubra TaxID=1088767 RepID=UPI000A1214E5|nr:ABC transporter permease [Thermoactinospora rubra]
MTQATAVKEPSPLAVVVGDCVELSRRSLRHVTRNVDEIIQAFVVPVVLLLMFRFLFGGAINTGGPSYVDYVIAGVIVLSVTFNSPATAVAVANDLQNGIVERFKSMPMFGGAVLVGHVVAAVLRSLIAVVLVIGLGLVVGFRPTAGPVEWLAVLAVLLLFIVAVAWVATLLGLVSGGVEAAGGYATILVFVPYASSALVPPETMPTALRLFVEYQPFTPVIDTTRALLLGHPAGASVWLALAWWVPILVLTMAYAVRRFDRRTNA